MDAAKSTTHQKARQINLDASIHGTFAEIGAGQEVARWFFYVGGAAATVAKTISAYDMAVSDAIYGPCDRYVSRRRLRAMLDYEYQLVRERLGEKRGSTTRFFVFADTVATRSHGRREGGHGWMGIRFQDHPQAEPSEIILHLRMLDLESPREQEAIGILGVNLTYGAFHSSRQPDQLIAPLMDDLTHDRVEVDMIKFSGPCFTGVDNRLMSLQLVEQGFTNAAMFTAEGEVVQPAEVLYNKPVLMERGSFRPVTHLTLEMLDRSLTQFLAEAPEDTEAPVVLMEMSLKNLLEGDKIEHTDFLARVDILGALGKPVMISNFERYDPIAEYLHRFTTDHVIFMMGIPNLKEIFDEKYYADLDGGILESVGRLFKTGVRLYVSPLKDPGQGRLVTVDTLKVAPHLRHLYSHLVENGLIRPIEKVSEEYLQIFPRDVLARIQRGDPAWESMVPERGVELIKRNGYFGYRQAPARPAHHQDAKTPTA